MTFLRNVWYAAAWAEEIHGALKARTVVGIPIVLFRPPARAPVALADTCPHRFAPLSRGALIGAEVECGYHGLRFGADGRCSHNPHGKAGEPPPAALRVRAFPAVDRHGVVWVWMGEAGLANPDSIPDLEFMAPDPSRRIVHNYHLGCFPYDLLIDNLLDLSHSEYLHKDTFSGGASDETTLDAWEDNGCVIVERTQRSAPPPPRYGHIGTTVDVTYRMRWFPSQVIAFDRYITPAGRPRDEGVHTRFCHIATPESAETTHYFHAVTRISDLDDRKTDERIRAIHAQAVVGEDVPMLEAIAERMGGRELFDLSPVSLGIDGGAMLVRSVVRRRLKNELELNCLKDEQQYK